MKRWTVVLVVCGLLAVGCAKPAEEPVVVEEATVVEWEKVLPGLMTDTQKAQQELVATAVNALASEMMGELMAALDSGDPTSAIGVCKEKAPGVAANINETYGVKIGRTSHLLRNTANVAPGWPGSIASGVSSGKILVMKCSRSVACSALSSSSCLTRWISCSCSNSLNL